VRRRGSAEHGLSDDSKNNNVGHQPEQQTANKQSVTQNHFPCKNVPANTRWPYRNAQIHVGGENQQRRGENMSVRHFYLLRRLSLTSPPTHP